MEIWKDVIDYEGLYQVSDLGNLKSLWFGKEKFLIPKLNTRGYLKINLTKNGIRKGYCLHRLVYEAFNGKTNLIVDHKIEGNKIDNRLCNLQAISQRENTAKHRSTLKKSSKYTGVSWSVKSNKWVAAIRINGKSKYLGMFTNEIDASNAYINAKNNLITH